MTEIDATDFDGQDVGVNTEQDADAAEIADRVSDLDQDEGAYEDEDLVAGIDFNLDNLSRPAVIAKCRKIIGQIRDLPDYPGRDTMLAELSKGIDEFEQAVRAEEFAAYELQVASRKARESDSACWDLIKDQQRH